MAKIKKTKWQQRLVWILGKVISHSLLVGVHTDVDTMEIKVQLLQKLKIGLSYN